MKTYSVSKAGYYAYALASVVLGILAAALPAGAAKVVCWIALLPSVLALPHMVKRYEVHMGSQQLVLVNAVLYGLFWLLLGANALGAQLPYAQLYVAWVIIFSIAICVESYMEARRL